MATATTYSDNYQIKLIGTDLEAGTWGVSTNQNMSRIEQALGGSSLLFDITLPGGSSSYSAPTLTWLTQDSSKAGAAGSEGRSRFVEFIDTNAVTPGSTDQTILVRGSSATDYPDRVLFVKNSLGASPGVDGNDIILDCNAGTTYKLLNGCYAAIYTTDGAVGNLLSNLQIEDLTFTESTITVPAADETALGISDSVGNLLSLDTRTGETRVNITSNYITGITSGSNVANITDIDREEECEVTADNTFANGYSILIAGVDGMVEVNGNTYEVSNVSSSAFKLKLDGVYVDSTEFTPYGAESGTATSLENRDVTFTSTLGDVSLVSSAVDVNLTAGADVNLTAAANVVVTPTTLLDIDAPTIDLVSQDTDIDLAIDPLALEIIGNRNMMEFDTTNNKVIVPRELEITATGSLDMVPAQSFTSLVSFEDADINTGAIDGTIIGANEAVAGTFDALEGNVVQVNTGLRVYPSEAGYVNFANSDVDWLEDGIGIRSVVQGDDGGDGCEYLAVQAKNWEDTYALDTDKWFDILPRVYDLGPPTYLRISETDANPTGNKKGFIRFGQMGLLFDRVRYDVDGQTFDISDYFVEAYQLVFQFSSNEGNEKENASGYIKDGGTSYFLEQAEGSNTGHRVVNIAIWGQAVAAPQPYVFTKQLKALNFDGFPGSDGYVVMGTEDDNQEYIGITDTFSLAIWAKSNNAVNAGTGLICIRTRPDSTRDYIDLHLNNSKSNSISFNNGTTLDPTVLTLQSASWDDVVDGGTNTWHHYVLTWGGESGSGDNGLKFYVDGAYVAPTLHSLDRSWADLGRTPADEVRGIRLGYVTTGTSAFDGNVYSAAVFDSVVTPAQVASFYNDGNARDFDLGNPNAVWASNLIHYFRMGGTELGYDSIPADIGTDYGTLADALHLWEDYNEGGTVPVEADLSENIPEPYAFVKQTNSLHYNGSTAVSGVFNGMRTPTANESLVGISDTFSMAIWIKQDLTTHTGGAIFNIRKNTTFSNSININNSDSTDQQIHIKIQGGRGSGNDQEAFYDNATAAGTNTWKHYVMTWGGDSGAGTGGLKFYIDGVYATPSDHDRDFPVSSAFDSTREVRLGWFVTDPSTLYGNIYSAAVLDRILTPAEVLEFYNGGNARDFDLQTPDSAWETNLVHYFRLGGTELAPLGYSSVPDDVGNDYGYGALISEGLHVWGSGTVDFTEPTTDEIEADVPTGYVFTKQTNSLHFSGETPGGEFNGMRTPVANYDTVGITNTFSLAIWVKQDLADARGAGLFSIRSATENNAIDLYYDSVTADTIAIEFTDNVPTVIQTATWENVVDGGTDTWHHYVLTWGGSSGSGSDSLKFYVDGSLTATTSHGDDSTGTFTDTARGVELGYYITDPSTMTGNIYSAAIFDRVLTPAEASALYNSGNGEDFDLQDPDGAASSAWIDNLIHYYRLGGTELGYTDDIDEGVGNDRVPNLGGPQLRVYADAVDGGAGEPTTDDIEADVPS